eukprot:TRINITY_DN316_c0_g1_i18.p1 TRINITY_DN316_c0_g1~~TRINITY_DN316_c0_g1_i18.p1  ORF type:complete len:375 (+),score=80.60 TRINITY_DN316_c0_g1_i18:131-1126(+)
MDNEIPESVVPPIHVRCLALWILEIQSYTDYFAREERNNLLHKEKLKGKNPFLTHALDFERAVEIVESFKLENPDIFSKLEDNINLLLFRRLFWIVKERMYKSDELCEEVSERLEELKNSLDGLFGSNIETCKKAGQLRNLFYIKGETNPVSDFINEEVMSKILTSNISFDSVREMVREWCSNEGIEFPCEEKIKEKCTGLQNPGQLFDIIVNCALKVRKGNYDSVLENLSSLAENNVLKIFMREILGWATFLGKVNGEEIEYEALENVPDLDEFYFSQAFADWFRSNENVQGTDYRESEEIEYEALENEPDLEDCFQINGQQQSRERSRT